MGFNSGFKGLKVYSQTEIQKFKTAAAAAPSLKLSNDIQTQGTVP